MLSLPTLEDYIADSAYLGRTIGPVANRVSHATFTIGAQQYHLDSNDGLHCLHSGKSGLHNKVWRAKTVLRENVAEVILTTEHPHLEGGLPGNKRFKVIYRLDNTNKLSIHFHAQSDKLTPVSLTNHAYFNLSGTGNILSHELYIDAAHFMPTDNEFIPTMQVASVADTPFDFRRFKAVGKDIKVQNTQLSYACGYNHNYVLRHTGQVSAILQDKESGRKMSVSTNMPGIQLYTGNYLQLMKNAEGTFPFEQYAGICLEAQNPPNSPNWPNTQAVWIAPHKPYEAHVSFQFSVESKQEINQRDQFT